jgi:hypothetical protein
MVEESLEILDDKNYIHAKRAASGKFMIVQLDHYGADVILKQKFPDYGQVEHAVGAYLCNNPDSGNQIIAQAVSAPIALVNHILDDFIRRNLIKASWTVNGGIVIFNLSAQLKRLVTG